MSNDPLFQRRALEIVKAAEAMTEKSGKSREDDEPPFPFDADELADEIVKAQQAEGTASSHLSNPDKVATLLRALAMGNYRETACNLAGIAPRTLQDWLQRGEGNADTPHGALYRAVHYAESLAEATARHRIDLAGRHPQFWTANAWALERKSPDRWGKRGDEGNVPKVVVQIGVRDGDVQVSLSGPTSAPALPSPSDDAEIETLVSRVQQTTPTQSR